MTRDDKYNLICMIEKLQKIEKESKDRYMELNPNDADRAKINQGIVYTFGTVLHAISEIKISD